MLCQLGDFIFESDGVNLESMKRSLTFDFEATKLINDHDVWAATGKFSQSITMGGILIAKSNGALLPLEELAKKKEPVTLAFEIGKALKVVIISIETDQSLFLKNGAFIKQDFQVQLGVVYGNI
ncbi:MAG: phage tail protein [Mariprofundus sp.]|nr:phage tail protein [Mariprofundus sp.]